MWAVDKAQRDTRRRLFPIADDRDYCVARLPRTNKFYVFVCLQLTAVLSDPSSVFLRPLPFS